MLDNFLHNPDAESLPLYPSVLKLVVFYGSGVVRSGVSRLGKENGAGADARRACSGPPRKTRPLARRAGADG